MRGPHLSPRGWLAPALSLAVAAACCPAWAQPSQPPAQDWQIGRSKARPCTVCHGELGLAVAADAPNLAGQPLPYLIAQLRAYRGGSRRHEVMSVMAKPLSNEDIDHLAAWFSSLRVEAKAPE